MKNKNYNDIYDDKEAMARFLDTIYSKGYDKAYEDCQIGEDEDRAKAIEEAYQKGLNDAWECAKKICLHCDDGGYSHKELRDILTESSWEDIFKQLSVSEVVAKIKDYEEKKKADDEIKVGDEVMVDERCMIVLGVDSGEWKQLWCPSSGLVHDNIYTAEMTKTGRHFDIQSLLNQMEGE